jgi:hypothetical protein
MRVLLTIHTYFAASPHHHHHHHECQIVMTLQVTPLLFYACYKVTMFYTHKLTKKFINLEISSQKVSVKKQQKYWPFIQNDHKKINRMILFFNSQFSYMVNLCANKFYFI